jgi:hypothetical protein
MAKEGLIAKQFMLGVVQTADGLPIYHEVFEGNTAETKTLLPTRQEGDGNASPICAAWCWWPIAACSAWTTWKALQAIHLNPAKGPGSNAQGQALEFIIAVPGRRYGEFADLLETTAAVHPEPSAEITA